MMRTLRRIVLPSAIAIAVGIFPFGAADAGEPCGVYDITEEWSDEANPNGAWSYREGSTPLPHVEAWQREFGGWKEFQPGWADSEDGTDRSPFWYKSNGTETFGPDTEAGDVAVHTSDPYNGMGNGDATAVWTSPFDGVVSLTGEVWMTRDIGRSVNWTLYVGDAAISSGALASGDEYSRAMPFDLATGYGGADALQDIEVAQGTEIRLRFTTSSMFGDIVGVRLAVTCDALATTTTSTIQTTTTTIATTTTTLPAGNCGDPLLVYRPGDEAGFGAGEEGGVATINASDALYVLRAAVGSVSCTLCECDVNSSGSVTATDSLAVLRNAVGQNLTLNCPPCAN